MSYVFRDFSGADDAHNYSLIAEMPLFFDNIQFTHAYKNIETTRAVMRGIRYYENEISIRQVLGDRFSVYYMYRRNDYTDDNSRNSNRLSGLYRILNQPKLYAGCVFVHDDTFFNTPVYYTPDNLRMVQALFRVEGDVLKGLKYNLRYAVGYAKERGSGDEIVHDGSVSLDRQAGERLEFGLLVTFSDTPNYASKSMQLNLKYRF
jgi:hypothetical protein